MTNDYIPPSPTARFGPKLISARQTLRTAINQLDEVKAIMDHNGDGTTWTTIESIFGLPAGKGQIVYDLINGTLGAMRGTFQNTNAITLTDIVG
jgi:hypothetical protein